MFQRVFAIKRALGNRGAGTPERVKLDQAFNELAKSLGESYHTAVESRAKPLLAQLRAQDATFYAKTESAMEFIIFLSHQYFRTANMRNRMYRLRLPRLIAHNPERTWPIESNIYATKSVPHNSSSGVPTGSYSSRTPPPFRSSRAISRSSTSTAPRSNSFVSITRFHPRSRWCSLPTRIASLPIV